MIIADTDHANTGNSRCDLLTKCLYPSRHCLHKILNTNIKKPKPMKHFTVKWIIDETIAGTGDHVSHTVT